MAAIGDTWRSHALLASEAGMSRRRFQLAVTDLVLDGRPILSGPLGYRLTDNPAELDDAAERLRHRATEILARASALRATAARLRDGVGRVQALPLDFAAQQ
jgi:biotin operon repressor